ATTTASGEGVQRRKGERSQAHASSPVENHRVSHTDTQTHTCWQAIHRQPADKKEADRAPGLAGYPAARVQGETGLPLTQAERMQECDVPNSSQQATCMDFKKRDRGALGILGIVVLLGEEGEK
ncbi:hypothetical protein JRQ81_013136, partial [Phrynocephalus forsythii]